MTNYLIIAIVALVVLCGVQTHRLDNAQTSHAEYVASIELQAKEASEKARVIEQQRQQAIEQVRTDAAAQKAQDEARAADLLAAGDSLRQQTAKLLADRAALNSRLAARGKTINDLTDLLAQLRTEADNTAGELATALDASRRSGFACERSYDAMRSSQ